jgi:uncharacterized OsmC-like protein
MEAKVFYEGGVRFAIEARGHRVVSDQPEANKGQDQGMTPPELMLASLGSCVAYYAVEFLKFRGLPTEGLTVSVKAQKVLKPARMDQFELEIETREPLDAKYLDGLVKYASQCLVHNTLMHPPEISVRVAQPTAI